MTIFSIDPAGKLAPVAQFKATRFDEGPSTAILRAADVPMATADNDLDVDGQAFPSAVAVAKAEAIAAGVDTASGPDRSAYAIVQPGRVDLVLCAVGLVQPIGDAE